MSSPGVRFVDCTPWSVGWIAPTPRTMQRTSHAIAVDGRVWFLDPVDDPEAIARALELGEPAGVVQLLDRHNRDCDSIAGRLGVPLYRLPTTTPDGAPFVPISVVDSRLFRWHEVALWFPALRALVVAEALGTASYFRARGEWVGPFQGALLVFGHYQREDVRDFRPCGFGIDTGCGTLPGGRLTALDLDRLETITVG